MSKSEYRRASANSRPDAYSFYIFCFYGQNKIVLLSELMKRGRARSMIGRGDICLRRLIKTRPGPSPARVFVFTRFAYVVGFWCGRMVYAVACFLRLYLYYYFMPAPPRVLASGRYAKIEEYLCAWDAAAMQD